MLKDNNREMYYTVIDGIKMEQDSFYDAYKSATEYIMFQFEKPLKKLEKSFDLVLEDIDELEEQKINAKVFIMQEGESYMSYTDLVHLWRITTDNPTNEYGIEQIF